ncbi:MAG: hypothetical protein KME08_12945 [Aphanothece sp. CMT-3BRIN-NPC111]|jgi:hypothetical protein|nr:hypothetical protein [Aphanothece sp. CMT-3BRIN-NPC111]
MTSFLVVVDSVRKLPVDNFLRRSLREVKQHSFKAIAFGQSFLAVGKLLELLDEDESDRW